MLFVCLTFDYELFMQDNNASYDEILFTPTEIIQAMLNEENAKGTFFADVCSAIVHKQCGLTKFSDAFLRQIQSLTKNGHDVQLHLHPSWYRAERRGDMLVPSHDGYRLHEFGFSNSRESAITIINDGIDYLNESLSLIDENYKCIAYRAGGFALQPERKIFEAMVQKGIVIDSSVVPHMKNYAINGFDFSDVPDCLNWWINSERGLNKVASATNKQIFEVPVATLRPRLLKYVGLPSGKLRLPPSKLLGTYVSNLNVIDRKSNKIKQLYKRLFDYRYVSLDTRYYERVIEDLLYIHKKYDLSRHDGYVCLICHPKLVDVCRVENIRNLIKEIRKHSHLFEIITIRDVYNKISDFDK